MENYKKMATAGAITVISHGGPGIHAAVYAPPTSAGALACTNWIAGESGMTVEAAHGSTGIEYYYVAVNTSWLAANWSPTLTTNRAITLWSICYSADTSAGTSVKEAAGGRWRGGYVNTTYETEAIGVNEKFLRRMNGTTDNALKRTAGEAYDNKSGYTPNLRMDGNWWTTLCPAPLALTPVYPASAVTENRKGWGCILFDTTLGNTSSVTDAVKKESGGALISDVRWLMDMEGKTYGIGFTFDKTSDNATTMMKAVSDKIRNENKATDGRKMDGDRVQPNDDDRQWSF